MLAKVQIFQMFTNYFALSNVWLHLHSYIKSQVQHLDIKSQY